MINLAASQDDRADEHGNARGALPCAACAAQRVGVKTRRLLERGEVEAYLALPGDKVQSLMDTRQITVLRIQGVERVDSLDLDLLIEAYKATARRRAR
jgi:hypothetical protein